MDQDDDMTPRGVPEPSAFQENPVRPEVPEVSLVFDSKSPLTTSDCGISEMKSKFCESVPKENPNVTPVSESYNVWRYKNAHLLNHVSSRGDPFKPAPIFSYDPEKVPISLSSSSYNKTSQQNINVSCSNDKIYSLSHPFPNEISSSPLKSIENLASSAPLYLSNNRLVYSNPSFESRDKIPGSEWVSNSHNKLPNHSPTTINKFPNPHPLNSGENRNEYEHQSENFKCQSKIIPTEEIRKTACSDPRVNMDSGKNEYHMNYVHFSSLSTPVSNIAHQENTLERCRSNDQNIPPGLNHVRNYQNFPSQPPLPVVHAENSSRLNYYLSNAPFIPSHPSEPLKSTETRKVSFEEPLESNFHSVSPCKCEPCVKKMMSRTIQTSSNHPPGQQIYSPPPTNGSNSHVPHTAYSQNHPEQRSSNGPSRSKKVSTCDLYNIVLNQTEQLAKLQEQVAQLLIEKNTLSICNHCSCSNINQSSNQHKRNSSVAIQVSNERRSVGVMTSFCESDAYSSAAGTQTELQSHNSANVHNGNSPCNCASHTNISTNTKTPIDDSNKRSSPRARTPLVYSNQNRKNSSEISPRSRHCEANDISLTLNAANLPPVVEQIPSPEPSVHVDMHDYHSSSDEESFESVKQNVNKKPTNGKANGWTFYENVIGQVNNILQNSPEAPAQVQTATQNPVNAIRQTTLDQLQKMGLSVFDDKNPLDARPPQDAAMNARLNYLAGLNNCESRESDLSLHMNQLAMKYLNKDQFTNAVGIQQDIAVCNMNGGTNLSFTTLRYLERYHLMPAGFKHDNMYPEIHREGKLAHYPPPDVAPLPNVQFQPLSNKVLDITALKQQPKLL